MSKIKVAELFYSIQGEGRYMGVPSVFLRTFGCNFTCKGFGMPAGKCSTEADEVAERVHQFRFYHELPLVNTGCDSYASWHPSFKHLSPMYDTDIIAVSIVETLPNKQWEDEHLVITGGEPLLGWQRAYEDLLSQPCMDSLKELTFETNGTQRLTPEFATYLAAWSARRGYGSVTFSVSPKLSISGEDWKEAICPEVVASYQMFGHTYLKFVVASEDDITEADRAVKEYRSAGFTGSVYLMPCGGVESVYKLNATNVALAALSRGWRYSDRLQIPLFKNAWGT